MTIDQFTSPEVREVDLNMDLNKFLQEEFDKDGGITKEERKSLKPKKKTIELLKENKPESYPKNNDITTSNILVEIRRLEDGSLDKNELVAAYIDDEVEETEEIIRKIEELKEKRSILPENIEINDSIREDEQIQGLIETYVALRDQKIEKEDMLRESHNIPNIKEEVSIYKILSEQCAEEYAKLRALFEDEQVELLELEYDENNLKNRIKSSIGSIEDTSEVKKKIEERLEKLKRLREGIDAKE